MTDDATQPAAGSVPEFTPQQVWVLDVVAERAANKVVDRLTQRECPLPCPKMDAVAKFCFGKAEDGLAGVDTRLLANEAAVARLTESITWLKRTVAGAIASGAVIFAVWGLEQLARR
jgi:hypothetical protein